MEKTFDEMMHNKFDALEEYGGFKLSTKKQNAILELMQEVREATIAECKEVLKDYKDGFGLEMLERNPLLLDRIRIEP